MRSPLGLLLTLAACQMPPSPPARPLPPDIHSFARPDEVVVRHVALDLDLDFDRHEARGSCALTLARHAPEAPLRLDSNGLAIGRVEDQDEAELAWSIGRVDPLLGEEIVVQLRPNTTAAIVHYRTQVDADAMQWLAKEQTSGDHPFVFTQGQAILTRSWIPLQDSPAVRVTWEARVRAPAPLRVLMSSEDRGGNSADGWTFSMSRPVPSYLIAMCCGDLASRAVSERCAIWAEPAVVDSAAVELEDTERMIQACEELFGEYRWGRYDVLILPPAFPFGGMENPCLTFATPTILAGDKSLVALIAHELAHSWSGNLVTNATWRDFWLNEGFTVYLEQRIMEHVFGAERARMEIALGMRGLAAELRELPRKDQILHIDLAGRNPDDGMTAIPYDKGAALLRRLEHAVGREAFDVFLRSWFDDHAFTSVVTETFESYLRQRLWPQNASALAEVDLREWIHGTGLPADAPKPQSALFEVVDAARIAVVAQRSAAPLSDADEWNTQQWLRFLDGLQVDRELCAVLDSARDFTQSKNSEILCVWLQLCIQVEYQPAMPRLEQFLMQVGRRKFLKPLYEKLCATEQGRLRAIEIYERARPRYHSVSSHTLDRLLGYQAR
jgi:leukotriene-A4 hydrolase